MSDVQGFPPSASDYVLSDEMFIDDIQKATNPKDRARRQEAVRRVIGAFNRAKRSMSLWSVSMLWNYLRTTDWVCSERHVSKHPEGRFLLEQDASTRWPMDWYGRLFVIQATCHKTDQLDWIHREHASHWGCAYHKGRPFYPDLYRDNSRNSRRSGSPEHSVAPSTLTQDSVSSLELDRGKSPPRPRSQSSAPTLANYDIINPPHLEETIPPSAVSQPTRPDRTSPEDTPAQVNRVISPLKQPTQPVHTSRKASPRPGHSSSASSNSILERTQPCSTNPEVPQLGYTGDGVVNHDPPKPFLNTFPDLSIPATLQTSQVGRPARTGPEISHPIQADPTAPPLRSQTAVPARTSSEATSIPARVNPALPLHDLPDPRGIPPEGAHPFGYTMSHDGSLIPIGMRLPNSRSIGQPMHFHGHHTAPTMDPGVWPHHVMSDIHLPTTRSYPFIHPTHVHGPHSPRPRSPRPIAQPMPVRGRRHSIITNPRSLRPRSPRHGIPHWSGRNIGPFSTVPDLQSCMIQATQAAQQAIELSQRSLHHVRRLEDFSNTMLDYVQQSVIHAHRSKNYMDESAAVTKGIQEEIRGSMANNEAAVTTANRALSLVERLRQYFSIEP